MQINATMSSTNEITYENSSTEQTFDHYRRQYVTRPARFTVNELEKILSDIRTRDIPSDAEVLTGGPIGKGRLIIRWTENTRNTNEKWTI